MMQNRFNKDRPFPKLFEGIQVGSHNEVVTNPYSGMGAELPPDAVAVYDVVLGSEHLGDYERVRAGLDWFRKYFPDEYMVLLD